MPIVGGLDIHRKQITFDYLDTVTGQVQRGQISPADREHLRAWLARFRGLEDVAFAVEGCTGWRYVVEELAAAGITAHLAERADTAFARGRKRHAKTDKTDCRHLRMLLAKGRLPECWIPPARILECRALLETYHDLRAEHTAWAQRIHAVLFHQGAPALAGGQRTNGRGRVPVPGRAAAGRHRPGHDRRAGGPGCTSCGMAAGRGPAPDRREGAGRAAVRGRAGHRAGDDVLAGQGKTGSPPPARWSGSPGWTSPSPPRTARARPGGCPGKDRRCCAGRSTGQGKTHARSSAPDYRYYAQVKDRCNGKRAALSEAREILPGRPATSWPSSATTPSPPPETPPAS